MIVTVIVIISDTGLLLSLALARRLEGGSGTTLSSRSDSKVYAWSQEVAGPEPFTVSAEIFTWYCFPLARPEMA